MGRKKQTQPPIPASFIAESFVIGDNSGQIIRRSTGEVATFVQRGKLMVRVYHRGRVCRVVAPKLAWCLAAGSWPRGVIKARDGDEHDLRQSNLIEVRRGPHPFTQSAGGKASSLDHRTNVTTRLLQTLAEHPGQTLPTISRSVGVSESCTCMRLSRLEKGGLTCGPKCNQRLRWDLSEAGRQAVASGRPLLDDLDRNVLTIIARSPAKLMTLVRLTSRCRLTIRRRADALIRHSLIEADKDRFQITDAGRAALPDIPLRWLKPEAISAAAAKDVLARHDRDTLDDRTSVMVAADARKARTGRPREGRWAYASAVSERHAQAG